MSLIQQKEIWSDLDDQLTTDQGAHNDQAGRCEVTKAGTWKTLDPNLKSSKTQNDHADNSRYSFFLHLMSGTNQPKSYNKRMKFISK